MDHAPYYSPETYTVVGPESPIFHGYEAGLIEIRNPFGSDLAMSDTSRIDDFTYFLAVVIEKNGRRGDMWKFEREEICDIKISAHG